MATRHADHPGPRAVVPGTARIVAPEHWNRVVDWDDAVADMAAPSVFLTRDWLEAWWRTVGAGERVPALVRVADRRDRTLGLAPFALERAGPGGRVRRLGLLGDRLVGSEYLGPVARRGHEAQVARAAIDALEDAGIGWRVARLAGGRPGDPAAMALQAAVADLGGFARTREEPCSAIRLPADVDRWMAGLGGSFRRRVRQRRRRLERDHAVRYRLVREPEDLGPALDRLFALHQARWRTRGRPGSFAEPRMQAFYRELAPRFLGRGRLRLWLLEVDGVVRAVQFGFAYAGRLHSLQEAYDSQWSEPGVSGLGVVLRLRAVCAAIEEGLTAYDFLGGDEDFKARWGTTPSVVREARVARPGPGGRAAWAATFGARDFRDRVAASLPVALKARLRVGAGR